MDTTTLDHAQLVAEQRRTLATPRRRYSPAARLLFATLDAVYGRTWTLSKFKVLEAVARVPYQAWEHVSYVALTQRYSRPHFARRVYERVREVRGQQDNEQWHLLILQELVQEAGAREPFLRYGLLPQVLAFVYYHLSWVLYVLRPRWSYALNADLEDHAEHQYAEFVADHPELEDEPYDGLFAAEYGRFASRADLFRQISYDERMHKEQSVAHFDDARFE